MAKAKESGVESKEEVAPVFSGRLMVGMVVYWFKEAKDHAEPLPAIVQRGYDSGVCDLQVLFPNGASMKEGVYHKTHPGLADHFGKRSDNAIRYGSWDFTPWTKDDYKMYVEQAKS